jgi:RNA polymerase sigma-70 factor (ECF subfamily)
VGTANHELQFRQWLGEHKGLLVKVARSFAEEPADQDDLMQEILLQVWFSLPNFREDSKLTTWLYRVAFGLRQVASKADAQAASARFSLSWVSGTQ